MKTITTTVYSYDELDKEAQERAYKEWAQDAYDPFMQSHMINLLKEELEARGIKYNTDSIDVRYSLAHDQSDGFMFEGVLEWNGKTVTIKHEGRYYHSNSKTVEIEGTDGLGHYDEDDYEELYAEFNTLYQDICKRMESLGYEHIEYVSSKEYFSDECEANEYLFTKEGKLFN